MENKIILQEDHAVHYGDFRITTGKDTNGKEYLKIATDKGLIMVKPQASNTVTIHSDKSKYEKRRK